MALGRVGRERIFWSLSDERGEIIRSDERRFDPEQAADKRKVDGY